LFTGNASEVALAIPAVIEDAGHSLGKLITVVEVDDEALPRVIDTLVAAQGSGREAMEDLDKHMVCKAAHCVPLVGGFLHLEELDTTHRRDEAALPFNCINRH